MLETTTTYTTVDGREGDVGSTRETVECWKEGFGGRRESGDFGFV